MLDFLGKISSFLYYVFALFIISITIYYGVFKGNQFLPKELNDFWCEVMYKERYCNRDWVLNRIAYTNYWIWSCEICDSLKYDKSFVLDALEFKNDRLFSLEDANSFANDKDVVLKAINTGSSLRFASSDLQCNKDIVLKSIEASSWNFSHICNELANDKEVITSLFKNSSKDDFEMFSVIFISYERTFDDSTSTLHNLINDRVFLLCSRTRVIFTKYVGFFRTSLI